MRRSIVARIAVAVLMPAMLWACGNNDSTSSSSGGGATTKASSKPLVVGFAQTGAESGWRTANTQSIQETAKQRGIDLRFVDSQGQPDNQKKAISSFIAQHVDVIMFSPIVTDGWTPILNDAKDAGIPVIISDRRVSSPDDLYTCFIGSNFEEEGEKAGKWLAEKTGGKAVIAELDGTIGSAPMIDRKKGFEKVIADHPGMKVVLEQSGDFTRAKGKEVMETMLKQPEGKNITAVFSHNDDMALGAIQAIKDAGKQPGKDIIIVSIDGIKDAFNAMQKGDLNCTVECNPLLGPALFDAAEKVAKGETVPKVIYSKEGVFDQAQVTPELIASRKY
ncbi:MAG: ABC transporter substrate-binding protein [Phycisphaerae bacterium]